jgi:hypothetical protein
MAIITLTLDLLRDSPDDPAEFLVASASLAPIIQSFQKIHCNYTLTTHRQQCFETLSPLS